MTPEEYNAQLQALQARRSIANAMLTQSIAQPSSWGNDRFAHSPLEAIANLGTTYLNKRAVDKADTQTQDAARARQEEIANALSQYQGAQSDPTLQPGQRTLAQKALMSTAVGPEQQAQMAIQQAMTPEKLDEIAPGGSLYSRKLGRIVFTAPSKPAETPDTGNFRDYEQAQKQGYKGSFFDYQIELAKARAMAAPVSLQNTDRPTPGGGKQPGTFDPRSGAFTPQGGEIPKGLTEGDKKNAVLFDSMTNAEKQITDLEKGPGLVDTSSVSNQLLGATSMTKPLQSDAFRKYESAALRWSANLLYLKSGATATPEEVQSTRKQFFPQPGDGPEVKAQKEQARQQELQSVRTNMVPNASPAPGGLPPDIAALLAKHGKK